MPTKFKAVLFDKDGTLIDLAGPWLAEIATLIRDLEPQRFEELAAAAGLETAPLRVVPFSALAQGSFADLAETLAAHTSRLSAQEILERLIQTANGSFRHVVPLAGTVETIKTLHDSGYILGIISNDCIEGIHFTINALNIASCIRYIAGSDSGFGTKPNTGMIADFCAQHHLEPEQVVMVGDGLSDMQTAEMSGCGLSIAIHPDSENPTLQHYTRHILPDISSLPELLLQSDQET